MELLTAEEMALAAQLSGSFLMTLTTLEKGKLSHHLVVNNFPDGDCLRSHMECEKLIIDHLKTRPADAPREEKKDDSVTGQN